MKKMRLIVATIAVIHAAIWTMVFRPGYAPERFEQVAMIFAAVVSFSVAMRPGRRIATIAQALNLMALGIYVLISFLWAKQDAEAAEGIALMFMTGAILLVILPPASSIAALHFLKGKCPNQASEAIGANAPQPQR